jgi:cysteine-rich repeat protein
LSCSESEGAADPWTGSGGSAHFPACGDGIVQYERGEVCDDGNTSSNDGCPSDCKALCGDGVVHTGETCDDGNEVGNDGCFLCKSVGRVLFRNQVPCTGPLKPGPHEIRLVCPGYGDFLFYRYGLDGKLLGEGPAQLKDPLEGIAEAKDLVDAPDGGYYVATQLQRNIQTQEGSQTRARVYRLSPSGEVAWHLDLTKFPGGPYDFPIAIAVGASGTVALTGLTTENYAEHLMVTTIHPDGTLLWKAAAPPIGIGEAVVVASDDSVIVSGATDPDTDGVSWKQAAMWGFSPSGQLVWETQDHDANGVSARSDDLALNQDGSLSVVGRSALVDTLVPNPPRSTGRLWFKTIEAATGAELTAGAIWLESFDGKDLSEVEIPLIRLARQPGFDVYAWTRKDVFGAKRDGTQVWKYYVSLAHTFGTIAIDHVWCASEFDDSHADWLTCVLIR